MAVHPSITVTEIVGKVFFVHDQTMCREESDPYDALLYFYPEQVRPEVQGLLSGQLMGMSNFLEDLAGKSEPQIISLRNDYYVTYRIGKYCLALGATYDIPEAVSHHHLASMYAAFCFFRGGFRTAHESTTSPDSNVDVESLPALQVLARFQHEFELNSSFARICDWVPHSHMDKLPADAFLKARFLLQSSYRKPGALAGMILFDSQIIVADVSDDLIAPLVLFKLLDDSSRTKLAQMLRPSSDLSAGAYLVRIYATAASVRAMHEANCSHVHSRHLGTARFSSAARSGSRADNDGAPLAAAAAAPPSVDSAAGDSELHRSPRTGGGTAYDDDDVLQAGGTQPLVPLALHYQEIGTHMTLMLLYDCLRSESNGSGPDESVMAATRKDVVNDMAKVEELALERVKQAAAAASSADSSYAYFHRCSLTHSVRTRMSETMRESTANKDMLESARAIHDLFSRSPAVRSVTLRNQGGSTGGSCGQGTETYYQLRGPSTAPQANPSDDPHVSLRTRVWSKLQAELGSRLL